MRVRETIAWVFLTFNPSYPSVLCIFSIDFQRNSQHQVMDVQGVLRQTVFPLLKLLPGLPGHAFSGPVCSDIILQRFGSLESLGVLLWNLYIMRNLGFLRLLLRSLTWQTDTFFEKEAYRTACRTMKVVKQKAILLFA